MHLYHQDGTPCYTITMKDGRLRDATLADAKKLKLVPSVTEILDLMAKPALTAWKVRKGVAAAMVTPRYYEEPDDIYIARVAKLSERSTTDAADEGKRIHDACELTIKNKPYPERYSKHVVGAMLELKRLFPGVDDWIAEKSFAHPSGYGGKCDLHSPSTGVVVDYKSVDAGAGSKKKLDYEQYYQLAAYQDGLRLPRNEGANIFISRTEPGVVFRRKWSVKEMEYGSAVFYATLELYKLIKKYDASWGHDAI